MCPFCPLLRCWLVCCVCGLVVCGFQHRVLVGVCGVLCWCVGWLWGVLYVGGGGFLVGGVCGGQGRPFGVVGAVGYRGGGVRRLAWLCGVFTGVPRVGGAVGCGWRVGSKGGGVPNRKLCCLVARVGPWQGRGGARVPAVRWQAGSGPRRACQRAPAVWRGPWGWRVATALPARRAGRCARTWRWRWRAAGCRGPP